MLALLLPAAAWAASGLSEHVVTSTVVIANYSESGDFVGWGSGFFVDEGIVVTNKHVIQGGDWYRVYATGSNEEIDFTCYKKITKSDVRVNLDDDVAYMRVFLSCAHGMMKFADDPQEHDRISVVGYPYKASTSVSGSLRLIATSGVVTGVTDDGWFITDAQMDVGNSGGPVVNGTDVVGVAVAKGIDDEGNYLEGYFIPSSVIERGLLYANDSNFGYTPQIRSSSSRSSSLRSSSSSAHSSSVSSSRSSVPRVSSVRSSAAPAFPDILPWLEGYEAILALRDRDIISGYPDGTFRPDNGINRAEFIKILVAGFRNDALRDEARCFRDVSREWFAQYVCAAKRLGWIEGYADGTFRPEQQINRAEAMKILIGAFGEQSASSQGRMPSDVRSGAWFYEYVAAGVAIGIIDPDVRFLPAQNLTREDGAIWIYGASS